MLLITRAYPSKDDYETPGDYNFETKEYTPPVMKKGHTPKVIAAREFAEEFGSYYLVGAENLPRDEFISKYGSFLPEPVLKLLNREDQPGNLNFKQSFHFNYS
jgi:hypothetical protein